jgi:integrase
MNVIELRTSPLYEAPKAWLESREPHLSAKTIHEYNLNIKTLSKTVWSEPVLGFNSFGVMRLTDVSHDHIRAYQRMRMNQCGPFTINHECSVLQQMLKRVGLWAEIEANYQPLPLPKDKAGRALTDAESKRLFEAAASNKNWQAAYLAATISVNTTAGPKEIYTLRLKDIDLEKRTMQVQPEGSKNVHRTRVIPLNDEALSAVKMALARAHELGSYAPDHYLFPFRIGGNRHKSSYDPARHQTTFKTAWNKLKAAAGIKHFRMYDLRHTAVTRMLENPECSEETVEAIAGHISREMKKRYSHVRIAAMRQAVASMNMMPGRKVELHNIDVLGLLEEHDAEIVAEKIKVSSCRFETDPESLKMLKARGVPKAVLVAMIRKAA